MTIEPFPNYIAGTWVAGCDSAPNINPSDLNDTIGHYAMASVDDTSQAIDAASKAFESWTRSTSLVRAEALDKIGTEIVIRKDELGDMLAREEGKTLREATGEAHRAGSLFKYFASEAYRETVS
ncbi:MAG: aldehyde dehydrogenase family protein, partial [Rhodobacteraceae bacterium]|nr:aldehyde dehydrogenase family protein [Paracoccaceae bacterium]